MEYKSADILQLFVKSFPDIVQNMKDCDHSVDGIKLNPFHMEGDVWTHTMMVFKQAITRYPDDKLLHIACLLHDIGKVQAREIILDDNNTPVKCRFIGHEGVSTFKAISILNSKEFEVLNLSQEDKLLIINTINLHGDFFESFDGGKKQDKMEDKFSFMNDEVLRMVVKHLICDHNGRISYNEHNSDTIEAYYPPRYDYVSRSAFITNEIVLLVGPPCSGKSTYLSNHKEYLDYTIISRDNTLIDYGKTYYPELKYSELFKSLSKEEHENVDKILMVKYQTAVKNKENILVDMTNMSAKSRRKWLQVPKTYKKLAVVFYTGDKELKTRNIKRYDIEGKYILGNVYINMFKTFKTPLYDEFDNIEYVL